MIQELAHVVHRRIGHHGERFGGEISLKQRCARQHSLGGGRQELPGSPEDDLEAAVVLGHIAHLGDEEGEAPLDLGGDGGAVVVAQPRGGQLDGQRQPFHEAADTADGRLVGGTEGDAGQHVAGQLHEHAHRRQLRIFMVGCLGGRIGEPAYWDQPLGPQVERPARGHQHLHAGGALKDLLEVGLAVDDLLEVVQDQEAAPGGQEGHQLADGALALAKLQPQPRRQARRQHVSILHPGQAEEVHVVEALVGSIIDVAEPGLGSRRHLARDLDAEAGLADAPLADERDEPGLRVGEQHADLMELGPSPDERRELGRKVVQLHGSAPVRRRMNPLVDAYCLGLRLGTDLVGQPADEHLVLGGSLGHVARHRHGAHQLSITPLTPTIHRHLMRRHAPGPLRFAARQVGVGQAGKGGQRLIAQALTLHQQPVVKPHGVRQVQPLQQVGAVQPLDLRQPSQARVAARQGAVRVGLYGGEMLPERRHVQLQTAAVQNDRLAGHGQQRLA